MHLCKDKYKLELHWNKIEFSRNNIARLEGATFSGPVINDVGVQIQSNDFIRLDFTPQHSIIFSDYHIAEFFWRALKKDNNIIYLYDTIIKSKYDNEICSLSNKNYIIINTEDHDTEKMVKKSNKMFSYKLPIVYKAYIMKEDGEERYGTL